MTINTNIKISPGNSKMGAIPSVSLPAIKTCRDCKCKEKCYAAKLERLRPTVRNAYQHNLEVLQSNPETFWREVEATVTSGFTSAATFRARIICSTCSVSPSAIGIAKSCASPSDMIL